MASGLPWRAAIIRSSWPAKMMASAKAPCRRPSARFTASSGRGALRQLVGDDVDDRLGVGVALEHVALGGELGLELAEVLDDAVVHDRDLAVHVRMRVALGGTPVRRPARVADAGVTLQRLLQQAAFEVAQLALGAAALEVAVLDGGDAGRIIAAILEPAQGVDEVGRDRSSAR